MSDALVQVLIVGIRKFQTLAMFLGERPKFALFLCHVLTSLNKLFRRAISQHAMMSFTILRF